MTLIFVDSSLTYNILQLKIKWIKSQCYFAEEPPKVYIYTWNLKKKTENKLSIIKDKKMLKLKKQYYLKEKETKY